jgi:hypothetical protein
LRLLRRCVRTPVVGIAWTVGAVVVGRRGPRSLAAGGSRRRIRARPWRTIGIGARYLRGLVRRAIGTSETCRRAATICGTSLCIPGARAVARAWRCVVVAHRRIGRPRGVRHCRRGPVLRQVALPRRRCGGVWRIRRVAVHRRRVVRRSIRCCGVLIHRAIRRTICGAVHRRRIVRGSIWRCGALIHRAIRRTVCGAVHRRVANATGRQAARVYSVNGRMRSGRGRRRASHHRAILNGGRRRGYV